MSRRTAGRGPFFVAAADQQPIKRCISECVHHEECRTLLLGLKRFIGQQDNLGRVDQFLVLVAGELL
jgi:hypothetical protein